MDKIEGDRHGLSEHHLHPPEQVGIFVGPFYLILIPWTPLPPPINCPTSRTGRPPPPPPATDAALVDEDEAEVLEAAAAHAAALSSGPWSM